jgi:hypothetical protein
VRNFPNSVEFFTKQQDPVSQLLGMRVYPGRVIEPIHIFQIPCDIDDPFSVVA